jgi:TetR/AcrR family transcriptional regulator, cholesterol catabolism regulator
MRATMNPASPAEIVSARATPPALESLDEEQRRRRARIVEAAVEMLLTSDYERIQMRDITAAAEVALGTTYRYFTSKDHLLAEALLAWAAGFPAVRSKDARAGRSADQLKRVFRLAVRAFQPHPTAYVTLAALQRSTDPYAAALFDRFSANQLAAFESYLPRVSPERRRNVVRVMNAVLHTHLRAYSFGREPIEEVYAMIDIAADLLLGG